MGSDDMADEAASNRAIAYVRVSTTRQAEEGNSIASQSVRIQKYAKDKGLRLMSRDIIIDDGGPGGLGSGHLGFRPVLAPTTNP